MLAFTFPDDRALGFLFGFIALVFIAWPVRLIRAQTHWGFILGMPILAGVIVGLAGTLSKMASDNPLHGHCGPLTYTGVFYPTRELLSAAHQDDLEIRNQLCWTRKLVIRVLPKFDSEAEYLTYTKITRDKLLKPERKYRVALPIIGYLYGTIINRWDNYNIPLMKNIQTGKLFLEEMKYWSHEYTEEVSAREYGWWDFLHGNYIKFEYGIVEKNWQNLLDGINEK
jgi:hypothetical protein